MRPGAVPKHGDVVVARMPSDSAGFTVRQLPGEIQFYAPTLDEAVHLARGFARKHGLDLWYGDADTYRLLESYRWPHVHADGAPDVNIL